MTRASLPPLAARRALAVGLFVALLAGVGWLAAARGTAPPASGKLRVAATLYPVAEFARQVGGDRVAVTTLVRPGVEPHDYDPSPTDIAGVYQSKLFVYNGGGIERWADRLTGDLHTHGVVTVEAGQGLFSPPDDPHIWLDPVRAGHQVDRIAAALSLADPAGAGTYHANAAAYKAQLAELDAQFRAGLATCSRHTIITAHDAFNYLAGRYGLANVSIAGLSPDEEPSPQALAQVTQAARTADVQYVFFEALASPKLADTLAREAGAQTLVLNPLEGLTADQTAHGDNYLSVQRQNINNLRIALDCK
jgi:zinc transport system substrate-binding protein